MGWMGGLVSRTGFALVMTFMPHALMQAQMAESQPLVIAAEDQAGPWGQADGTGCGNELVLAAYAAVKVPVKLEVMPYARAKNGVMAGSIVGCFGMAWTPELKDKVLFADRPLYSVTAVLMESSARPLKAADGRGLRAGTKIGTVLGYEYPSAFHSLVKQRKLTIMPSFSEVNSLKNLDLNRIDAALVVVDELKNTDYLVAQAHLAGRVDPAFVVGGQDTYLGFSLAHPRSEYARTKFNEGFTTILKDGTYKRILATWKAKQTP
jgi:polar amino acid transport system substrate-binding protein